MMFSNSYLISSISNPKLNFINPPSNLKLSRSISPISIPSNGILFWDAINVTICSGIEIGFLNIKIRSVSISVCSAKNSKNTGISNSWLSWNSKLKSKISHHIRTKRIYSTGTKSNFPTRNHNWKSRR